jgi:O-antigen ligase
LPTLYGGPCSFWLPFAALSLLGLLSLQWPPTANTYFYLTMLVAAWLLYLYLINERPRLTVAIGLLLLIQSSIAIAQFFLQHEVGLAAVGEVVLDLDVEGTSVLWGRGRNWLRGYGLTTHPNILGAMLCTCLLLFLPQLKAWSRWTLTQQLFFMLSALIGLAGLFITFSRAAWLAFAVGSLFWLLGRLAKQRRQAEAEQAKTVVAPRLLLVALILMLPTLWLFLTYSDLALGRFLNLESPLETTSIRERVGSAELSLRLIATHPWFGVGLGQYLEEATEIDSSATRVHNIPLLIAAELGVIGLLLWLWLVLAPFWRWWRPTADPSDHASLLSPAQLAPWVAMIVLNLFDTTLWLGENWQTALLFIVLAAHLVRPVNGGQ